MSEISHIALAAFLFGFAGGYAAWVVAAQLVPRFRKRRPALIGDVVSGQLRTIPSSAAEKGST